MVVYTGSPGDSRRQTLLFDLFFDTTRNLPPHKSQLRARLGYMFKVESVAWEKSEKATFESTSTCEPHIRMIVLPSISSFDKSLTSIQKSRLRHTSLRKDERCLYSDLLKYSFASLVFMKMSSFYCFHQPVLNRLRSLECSTKVGSFILM